MKKLILFDLDGVLTDTKEVHYNALNEALALVDSKYVISYEEHLERFDGLKTHTKLQMLTDERGLPPALHTQVYENKQETTIQEFSKLKVDEDKVFLLKTLREQGYEIGCCTNCIRRTAMVALSKIGVLEFLDYILTNDDVVNAKPHPEIYWKAISEAKVLPEETLIVEDSPQGLLSAIRSKADVLRVDNASDLTLDKIQNKLMNQDKLINKWNDKNLNVLVPMAGAGSRFAKAGYSFPKPLIDIKGKPMIQVVSDSLRLEANFIYVVQKEHRSKYNLDTLLNMISPRCTIVEVSSLTEGAACTTLLAKEFIDNDSPLIISNSDQLVDWDSLEFMYKMKSKEFDGGIICFNATHPKWSFAKTDDQGLIVEVAEKNPISNNATAGIYYWKHGADYVKYAEQMIEKDIRINNEFYVCPVYNEAIGDGKKIDCYKVDSSDMWGLGTPEDLEYFLLNYGKK
jgi:HAD superfamily hydrolase (TIGR01509 family)